MMRAYLLIFIMCLSSLHAFDYCDLTRVLYAHNTPFNYELQIKVNPGPCRNANVTVAFHGSGSNNTVGDVLASYPVITDHIVSFNLPDHDSNIGQSNPHCLTYGTIHELLPAIYLIKKIVIDGGAESINLYGFSAGGGVLVNVLGVLNSSDYDQNLEAVGIRCSHKKQMLDAIQKGHIVLDVPLKSVEEIIAHRGSNYDLFVVSQHYRQWNLRPINSLERLDGLNLNILVYFEDPDNVLSNRDDELFIQRLRSNNPHGNTVSIIGCSGGHMGYHAALWEAYLPFIQGRICNTLIKKVVAQPYQQAHEATSQLYRIQPPQAQYESVWCPTDPVERLDEWYEYPCEESCQPCEPQCYQPCIPQTNCYCEPPYPSVPEPCCPEQDYCPYHQ